MTEQTSASDRYEAARKALADYDAIDGWNGTHAVMIANAERLADALRALITPPSVGESEEAIAQRLTADGTPHQWDFGSDLLNAEVRGLLRQAVRAGIQSAHESWEPEVAQRPTQEQMLRWLKISYGHRDTHSI